MAAAAVALDLADALRRGRGTASPFELWQAADREGKGVDQARRDLFRHAMIHAGYLMGEDGGRYRKCPVCDGQLAG